MQMERTSADSAEVLCVLCDFRFCLWPDSV